eukprot:329209-Prorocentrum_lima.AAC.1
MLHLRVRSLLLEAVLGIASVVIRFTARGHRIHAQDRKSPAARREARTRAGGSKAPARLLEKQLRG